jgi:hypothetical protein
VEAKTSHPKATCTLEPGKCIPQTTKEPRYVINSTRVGEHTEFIKYHALIRKLLGLWPSKRDLSRWIKNWWNPKGEYDLQLNSKGFFTIIFYNLEDKDRVFENGPYSFNSGYIFDFGQIVSAQKKRISLLHQCGSTSTPFPRV